MKTKKFNITLGVASGYSNLPVEEDVQKNYFQYRSKIQEVAQKIYDETGVFVSCSTTTASAIYSIQWGAPASGEGAVCISGVCNTSFTVEYKWIAAVKLFGRLLKEEFKQATVTIEFMDVDIEYLN